MNPPPFLAPAVLPPAVCTPGHRRTAPPTRRAPRQAPTRTRPGVRAIPRPDARQSAGHPVDASSPSGAPDTPPPARDDLALVLVGGGSPGRLSGRLPGRADPPPPPTARFPILVGTSGGRHQRHLSGRPGGLAGRGPSATSSSTGGISGSTGCSGSTPARSPASVARWGIRLLSGGATFAPRGAGASRHRAPPRLAARAAEAEPQGRDRRHRPQTSRRAGCESLAILHQQLQHRAVGDLGAGRRHRGTGTAPTGAAAASPSPSSTSWPRPPCPSSSPPSGSTTAGTATAASRMMAPCSAPIHLGARRILSRLEPPPRHHPGGQPTPSSTTTRRPPRSAASSSTRCSSTTSITTG